MNHKTDKPIKRLPKSNAWKFAKQAIELSNVKHSWTFRNYTPEQAYAAGLGQTFPSRYENRASKTAGACHVAGEK